jgi:hypothetical protein
MYHAVVPSRVYDSRWFRSPVKAGQDRTIAVAGRKGVPATGVSAVVVQVTVVGSTVPSAVRIYPAGVKPLLRTSTLNARSAQPVTGLATTALGTAGAIGVSTAAGATHVVVDVIGWYGDATAASGDTFRPLRPTRLVDTRRTGGAVVAGHDRAVRVTGVGGVPAAGVASVVVNATVVGASGPTDLQLYPTSDRPATRITSVVVTGRDAVAGLAVVPVGWGGTVGLSIARGSGHVILDVVGWYGVPTTANPGSRFHAVAPARLLDSRATGGPLLAGRDRSLLVVGRGGVPLGATGLVGNLTVVDAIRATDVRVFPSGTARPGTSNVNASNAAPVPNAVVVGLGRGGAVSLTNATGSVNVVLDLVGWFGS